MMGRRIPKSKIAGEDAPVGQREILDTPRPSGCARRVLLDVLAALVIGVAGGRVLFNVAAYAGAARHRRGHPASCAADADDVAWPARCTAWLGAFGLECTATALLVLATPLALRRVRVRTLDGHGGRRPVVFLHGYAQH